MESNLADLIIDDNDIFLAQMNDRGLSTICSHNKSIKGIVTEIGERGIKKKQIAVNMNLKLKLQDKRLDFLGLKLIQQLGFSFPGVGFLALSFLDYDYVVISSSLAKAILECENVVYMNYVEFLGEIAN